MKALFETLTLIVGSVYVVCLLVMLFSGTISSPGAFVALAVAFSVFRVAAACIKPPLT